MSTKAIEELINLAKRNHRIDLKRGEEKYLDPKWALQELKSEIEEVKEEINNLNTPYLEDELGDILWGLFMLMTKLEEKKYIESFDKVFQRALKKYKERILPLTGTEKDDEIWKEIKKRQKKQLQEELHKKKLL